MKKKLSNTTSREMGEHRRKALENFHKVSTYEILAKRFLKDFFEFNVYSADFKKILDESQTQAPYEDFPEAEDEFYQYICRWYLDLKSLPSEKLIDLYVSASQDLKSINKTLKSLKKKGAKLDKKKKGSLKAEETQLRKLITHYEKKNTEAKEEINTFLAEEINKVALLLASTLRRSFHSPFSTAPYHYARRKFLGFDSYNIDNVSDVMHKFLELGVPAFRKLLVKYKNNNKVDFYDLADDYIKEYAVVEKIKNLIPQSHLLHERAEVFAVLLKSYENDKFLIFNHMTPLQIEGLFGDCCLALGVSDSDLEKYTLKPKLEHIKKEISFFHCYEYFAFRFPVIRNKIAHGRIPGGNPKHLAQMLLLDLYPVCQMLVSDDLPLMKSLSLLKTIADSTGESMFEPLEEWLDLSEVEIPAYYDDAGELVENAKLHYQDEEFWRWLKKRHHSSIDMKNSDAVAFVKKLKRKKIADNQCDKFFAFVSKSDSRYG